MTLRPKHLGAVAFGFVVLWVLLLGYPLFFVALPRGSTPVDALRELYAIAETRYFIRVSVVVALASLVLATLCLSPPGRSALGTRVLFGCSFVLATAAWVWARPYAVLLSLAAWMTFMEWRKVREQNPSDA
jgi:hypothetical protein